MASNQTTHRYWGYTIQSYWGPRPETPEDLAQRLLRTFDALAPIHPLFQNWFVRRDKKRVPLASLNEREVAQMIADGVSREDDGDPFPQMGYLFGAFTEAGWVPRLVEVSVQAGNRISLPGYINSAAIQLRPLNAENSSAVRVEILKPAALALAAAWDVTWCSAYPTSIIDLWPKLVQGEPSFRLAWMVISRRGSRRW